MQEPDLTLKIQILEDNVKKLLHGFLHLKQQYQQAEIENTKLKSAIEAQKMQLEELSNQQKIQKFVKTLDASGTDSKELKRMLDEYIQKIDSCIIYLNQHI